MWTWIVGGLAVWAVVAVIVGVVVGRGIRLADSRSPGTGVTPQPLFAVQDIAAQDGAQDTAPVRRARARRRSIPLPPVGVALVATAVALETTGFVLRLNGAGGPWAQAFSMDAPYSLPRLYVAALFGAAALAAAMAAARTPARRAWWLGVAVVAAGIAVVKAGSTVHSDAMQALVARVGASGALTISVVLAGVAVAVLAFLTRTERRDRRRVLGTLTAYAVASVGLSAVPGAVGDWYVMATYLEEAGEALAGVAFLLAVLVAVAPRLVLPADWALRRRVDAETLEVFAPQEPGTQFGR